MDGVSFFDGNTGDKVPFETRNLHYGQYTLGHYNDHHGVLVVIAHDPHRGRDATYVTSFNPSTVDALKSVGFNKMDGLGVPQVQDPNLFADPEVAGRVRTVLDQTKPLERDLPTFGAEARLG